MKMPGRLDMHRDDIGACVSKGADILIRMFDHQMDVQDGACLVRQGAKRAHNKRANGDVGYEVSIHHVHVQPFGAGRYSGSTLFTQSGKIGRQDTGRQDGHDVL